MTYQLCQLQWVSLSRPRLRLEMAEAQKHEQDEATATEEVRQQRSLFSKVPILLQ